MICEKIDEALVQWNLKYVYVSTEDESYCRYLKERYKDKIFLPFRKDMKLMMENCFQIFIIDRMKKEMDSIWEWIIYYLLICYQNVTH